MSFIRVCPMLSSSPSSWLLFLFEWPECDPKKVNYVWRIRLTHRKNDPVPFRFGVDEAMFALAMGLGMASVDVIRFFTFDEEEQKEESSAASSSISNAASSSSSFYKWRRGVVAFSKSALQHPCAHLVLLLGLLQLFPERPLHRVVHRTGVLVIATAVLRGRGGGDLLDGDRLRLRHNQPVFRGRLARSARPDVAATSWLLTVLASGSGGSHDALLDHGGLFGQRCIEF